MLGKMEGRRRGRDGWMPTPTQWTWVWANSGRWWRTGRPGVLPSRGSQRVGHDWATEQPQHAQGCHLCGAGFCTFRKAGKGVSTMRVSVVSCCRRDGPYSHYCLHSTEKKLTDRNVSLFFIQAISEIGFTTYWLASIHLLRKIQQRRHFENCIRGCVGIAERWGQPKRTNWKYNVMGGHPSYTTEMLTCVGSWQLVRTGFLLKALFLSTPKWMGRAISTACPGGGANWPRTYPWSVDRRGWLCV